MPWLWQIERFAQLNHGEWTQDSRGFRVIRPAGRKRNALL